MTTEPRTRRDRLAASSALAVGIAGCPEDDDPADESTDEDEGETAVVFGLAEGEKSSGRRRRSTPSSGERMPSVRSQETPPEQ